MLRHGLEVEESVSSELPGVPNGVWTVKVREDGKSFIFDDAYFSLNKSFIISLLAQTYMIAILFYLL